jgi:hypothetical protein
MRKLLLVLAIVVATTAPSHASDFWRESGQACFFGAAVLGVSAAMVLYPAVASGATTLPAATLVIGNTIFGCGLGMVGSMAAYGFRSVYDRVVPTETEPAVAPQTAPVPPPKNRGSVT